MNICQGFRKQGIHTEFLWGSISLNVDLEHGERRVEYNGEIGCGNECKVDGTCSGSSPVASFGTLHICSPFVQNSPDAMEVRGLRRAVMYTDL
jgi:hypothetical protein